MDTLFALFCVGLTLDVEGNLPTHLDFTRVSYLSNAYLSFPAVILYSEPLFTFPLKSRAAAFARIANRGGSPISWPNGQSTGKRRMYWYIQSRQTDRRSIGDGTVPLSLPPLFLIWETDSPSFTHSIEFLPLQLLRRQRRPI